MTHTTQDNTGGDTAAITIGAAWMREQAAIACNVVAAEAKEYKLAEMSLGASACCKAIRALPLPTDADLLADAMKLPEVAALVEVAAWIQGQMCEGFCRHLPAKDTYSEDMDFDCAVCRLRSALAPFTAVKETP